MSLLYDKSLSFPPACSSKKLEACVVGKSKQPSAWAPENEDEEDTNESVSKQHWYQVTVDDNDMELEPLPWKKVASSLCCMHLHTH